MEPPRPATRRARPGPLPGHAPGPGVSPLLVVLVLPVAVAGAVDIEGELDQSGPNARAGRGQYEEPTERRTEPVRRRRRNGPLTTAW